MDIPKWRRHTNKKIGAHVNPTLDNPSINQSVRGILARPFFLKHLTFRIFLFNHHNPSPAAAAAAEDSAGRREIASRVSVSELELQTLEKRLVLIRKIRSNEQSHKEVKWTWSGAPMFIIIRCYDRIKGYSEAVRCQSIITTNPLADNVGRRFRAPLVERPRIGIT
jgi:hypothetical protein